MSKNTYLTNGYIGLFRFFYSFPTYTNLSHFCFLLFSCLFLFLGNPTLAATPTPSLHLNEAIRAGLLHYPLKKEQDAYFTEKQSIASEIEQIQNPTIRSSLRNNSTTQERETEWEIEQAFRWSDISGSRRQYAKEIREHASLQYQYDQFILRTELSRLFIIAWKTSQQLALYDRFIKELEPLARHIRQAANQGQTSPASAELFDADYRQLQMDRSLRLNAKEQALLMLRQATSLPLNEKTILLTPDLPKITTRYSAQELEKLASQSTNPYQLDKHIYEQAKAQQKMATDDGYLPELSTGISYTTIKDAHLNSQNRGISVSARIPLWHQNQAERLNAKSNLQLAQAKQQAWNQRSFQAYLYQFYAQFLGDQHRAYSYQHEILPRYRNSYRLSQAMFKQGQLDAFALWQVKETLFKAEQESIEAVATTYESLWALERGLGQSFSDVATAKAQQ
jgi:outer membrane protein TolC